MRLTYIGIIALATTTACAQAKPNQAPKAITPFTISLFSADALLRVMDGYTTVTNLNDPCKCIHETNPLAPHSGSVGKQIAFQASALAVATGSAWLLNHYHHPKIARAIMTIDVANETRSLIGNVTVNHIDNVNHTVLSNKLTNNAK
jgi:hypothetical protein